jgi:phosphoribosylanthranilate isomerase
MNIKICGISNEIDAMCAIKSGADAIGLVMGGRVLPVEVEPYAQHVRQFIKKFPRDIDIFLVTHFWTGDDILALAQYIGSTGIQVSEDIDLEEIKFVRQNWDGKIIKTIVSNDPLAEEKIRKYQPYCDLFLLDSRFSGYTGGTGFENNWDKCRELINIMEKPAYIAGGLNPENVVDAIGRTNPFGVDVSTGISTFNDSNLRKDRKDPEKIRKFIELVKG